MKHRCPVCNKIVQGSIQERTKEAIFFPFCSKRCKFVDLGEWVDQTKLGDRRPTMKCAITFDDGWNDNFDFAFPVIMAAKYNGHHFSKAPFWSI